MNLTHYPGRGSTCPRRRHYSRRIGTLWCCSGRPFHLRTRRCQSGSLEERFYRCFQRDSSCHQWRGFHKKSQPDHLPFEIEGGKTTGSADIVIRKGSATSQAIGTLSGSRAGGVAFYDKGRSVQEDGEAMGHELAHYFFEIYDESIDQCIGWMKRTTADLLLM